MFFERIFSTVSDNLHSHPNVLGNESFSEPKDRKLPNPSITLIFDPLNDISKGIRHSRTCY